MRISDKWIDYKILDTSSGEKLEDWAGVKLIRPDPQIIWNTEKTDKAWNNFDGHYIRSNKGGGEWDFSKSFNKKAWQIKYKELTFNIKPTGFKHTGLFPEQAVNWEFLQKKIKAANRPVKVLNLFAYTGGATLACAAAGASICHVDASKGMVAWARENAQSSNLSDKPIRWIIDDCEKFVKREIRRGSFYDILIMDPPSYGRGPNGEIFKLEDQIYGLVDLCSGVLSDNPLAFLLNSYTTGLSPSVMMYLLAMTVGKRHKGVISADEIALPVESSGYFLPCGSTAIWESEN